MRDNLNQLYGQFVFVTIGDSTTPFGGQLHHDGHFWYICPGPYMTIKFSADDVHSIYDNQIYLF